VVLQHMIRPPVVYVVYVVCTWPCGVWRVACGVWRVACLCENRERLESERDRMRGVKVVVMKHPSREFRESRGAVSTRVDRVVGHPVGGGGGGVALGLESAELQQVVLDQHRCAP
jgi:hypothetical protein